MKTHRDAIRLVICMLAILLAAGRLPAQIDRSSISGTVTDPSGAVVPGATVVVTNTATSESVTLTTASDGSYTASLLHVVLTRWRPPPADLKRPGKPSS